MLLQSIQSFHDPGKKISSGYCGEAFRAQTVQGEVDAHAQILEQGGMRSKHDAIAGEAQIDIRMRCTQAGQKLGKPLAHKGFASGKPNLAYSHGHKQADHFFHFLITHDPFMRNEAVVHPAVAAAQIAAIRYGKAQIVDFAAEGVLQGRG